MKRIYDGKYSARKSKSGVVISCEVWLATGAGKRIKETRQWKAKARVAEWYTQQT